MLKLHWIEFFLRSIPETLLLVWGIYVICKAYFNLKKYIMVTIILSACIFFIRRLPIYWGIHTLISIILVVSVMFIEGIPLISSIYGTLAMLFILSLSELLNLLILNMFKIEIHLIYIDSIIGSIRKCLLGIPSLIIMFLFIRIIDHLKKHNINLKRLHLF